MPRNNPGIRMRLTAAEAVALGKPGPGQYRLTVTELVELKVFQSDPAKLSQEPEPDHAETAPESQTVTAETKLSHPEDRRLWLRARLEALKAEYLSVARDQDRYPGRLAAINAEREPMFAELHRLESALPPSERYWMPARFVAADPFAGGAAPWRHS